MRQFITWLFFLVTIPVWSACSPVAIDNTGIGMLVLAHGAGHEWNQAVREAVNNVRGNFKKEIIFGMGDAAAIQQGIRKLERSGAEAIIVIPLFVSSASEMYRNLEYVLGLHDEPDVLFWLLMTDNGRIGNNHSNHSEHGMNDITAQVTFTVPYVVAPAINYHPLVASILEERLREIEIAGKDTSIFLVAHGPISESDNKVWLRDLSLYSSFLARKFKGLTFSAYTFRDDAPPFIRDRAIEKIKEAFRRDIASGRKIIVLPYLLAPGGRESEIKKIFKDCSCAVNPKPLLPHKNISLWIEEQIRYGQKQLLQ